MKTILLWLFSISLLLPDAPPTVDRSEAQKAFVLLNKLRTNPNAYVRELPFLKDIHAMPALKWNDTLAKVAEAKALDMAVRDYVDHRTPEGYGINYSIHKAGYTLNSAWIASPELNYFESLHAGTRSGEEAVKSLLVDKGVPSLGHRKHLLGIGKWNASLPDVGIGYVRTDGNSRYISYVCVIIAKHDW